MKYIDKIEMKSKEGTVVVTDIRNFTQLYKTYQNTDIFYRFMSSFYKRHLLLVDGITKDCDIKTNDDIFLNDAGDSVILIFYGDNHYLDGYAFALGMYRSLTYLCKSFNSANKTNVSFGIGIDSGMVTYFEEQVNQFKISTYNGDVINISSRIQDITKMFHNTNMAVGNNIYVKLMEKFHPEFIKKIDTTKKNYDDILKGDSDFITLSKEFMLFYIFELNLKGVDTPLPLFRLSPKMPFNNELYWGLLERLVPEKFDNIRKTIY